MCILEIERKIGFNNDMYIEKQSEQIKKRIDEFGGKLYLEFGGKLFDDFHAARVLPGFKPDSKLQMLLKLKEQAEIVIVISANDIESNKVRRDLGITYDIDVLRLMDAFSSIGLYVGSVVITQFSGQPAAIKFKEKLETLGIKSFVQYIIEGYPYNVQYIVSDNGFGKNDYIEPVPSLLLQHPVPVVAKCQLVFLNSITKMLEELKQVTQNLKHSLYGIYHSSTLLTLLMKRQPPTLTTLI